MVRMCADGTLPPAQRSGYKNAIHGLYSIWRQEGLARCFRGVQLTLARSVVMNASQLSWWVLRYIMAQVLILLVTILSRNAYFRQVTFPILHLCIS
jgi:hypothetical protein